MLNGMFMGKMTRTDHYMIRHATSYYLPLKGQATR